MTNRLIAAGDETKYSQLAGFGVIADDDGTGVRGGSGFLLSPILERVAASFSAAALAARFSTERSDLTGGGRDREAV